MENTNWNAPPVAETLVFTTTPSPENHVPESWLELALQNQSLALKMDVGTQPIFVIIKDP
ncbi:hypothetical protein KY284_000854 [Solanum tuberosum]|nr:hypothetical protein KY284_000854 [Solanum tuberosum]